VEDRKFICPCYRHERDIAEDGYCICHLFVSEDYTPPVMDSPPIRSEDSPWPHMIMYGARWCSDTIRSANFLNRHEIPYTYIDVDNDERAAERVRDWNQGYLSTPTIDIEGQIVTEPADEELAHILGIEEE
jgi:mycoredoxin